MKCTSKKEYDCFYLNEDNIENFVSWFKTKINSHIVSYRYDNDENFIIGNDDGETIDINCVVITINDEYCEGNVDLYYDINRWYVLKDGDLLDYSYDMFKKMYAVEEGVLY